MFPLKQQSGGMFGRAQQQSGQMGRMQPPRPSMQPQGIGPSMGAMGGMMKPPQMSPPSMGQANQMPPQMPPPNQMGGLGPSMAAFGNMMQQPPNQPPQGPPPMFGRQPEQMYNPQMKMY